MPVGADSHCSFRLIKDITKKAILGSRALRLAAGFRGSSAAILMYHSVLPDPSLAADSLGGITHAETVFRAQMELLARDFNPISLDELFKHVSGAQDLPKRSIVVTFDDGYVDNCQIAMPLLNQAGIPATFYVTVDCVQNQRPPWPSRLRFAFRHTKRSGWDDFVARTWPLNHPGEREEAFLAACDRCCQLSGAAQEAFMTRIERQLEVGLSSQSGSFMMNFENLQALTRNGHVVGSHTMTHPNMAYLNEDDARSELAESKRLLDLNLDVPVRHFSYPCPALSPHWSAQTVALSRTAGYESCVTTDGGVVKNGDNPLCLKRVRPSKTVEGLRWNLESAFAGRKV